MIESDFRPHLTLLWQLDTCDRARLTLTSERDDLKQKAKTSKQEVETSAATLLSLEQQFAAMVKERAERETELKNLEARILRTEQLSGAHSHRDFSVAQREMEVLGARKGEVEERVLTLMMQQEDLEPRLVELRTGQAARQASYERKRHSLKKLYDKLGEDLAANDTERTHLLGELAKIAPTILKEYLRVMAVRGDRACTVVEEYRCLPCHLSVIPQHVVEVGAAKAVHQCQHCNRFILLK